MTRPTIEYEPVSPPRITPAKFWVIYAVCCIVGLSVLEPTLAHLLWGHPGDQLVGGFVVASAAVVTAVVGVAYGTLLRRLRPAYGFSIAAATGLAAFLPAYAVLYLFF